MQLGDQSWREYAVIVVCEPEYRRGSVYFTSLSSL